MKRVFFVFAFYLSAFSSVFLYGQSRVPSFADFSIPATVCVGDPVTVTNLSTGTSSWFWAFCKADPNSNPQGINTGNPNNTLLQPYYITLVRDGTEYYSFITNKTDGSITRIYHKNSLTQTPVAAENLGNFNVLDPNLNGIQVLKSGNNWYGFVVDNNNIYRLDFGTSLQNTPTLISLGVIITPTSILNGLLIFEEAGSFYGFYTDEALNTISRLTWGASLVSVPSILSMGNIAAFNKPAQLVMRKQDTSWCMMVCNEGDSTISRLKFGSSVMNAPLGENLGHFPSLAGNRGISLVAECNDLNNGFVLNYNSVANPLSRLNLNGGICEDVTIQPEGNPGGLNQPSIFSDFVRLGDTLFAMATNSGNSTLSLIYFPDCLAASIRFSTLEDPLPYSYNAPGTYTVILITDDGTPARQEVCKDITVIPSPQIDLGNDTLTCTGQTVHLDAGSGYVSYLWSTGATTQTVNVTQTGTYWAEAVNSLGCSASDTVNVTFSPALTGTLDTLICYGVPYFAGGSWQTSAGTYLDTLKTGAGCDSVLTTHLTYKPQIPVDLGSDRYICPGEQIHLSAYVPGGTYRWQDGVTDSTYTVFSAGTYWVHVTKDSCMAADTVRITDCPSELWFPNAFTPNEDGLNDVYRPKGVSIAKFHMSVYDRWGTLLYETDDLEQGWNGTFKGQFCPPGVYIYYVNFEGTDDPGKNRTMSGSFSLVR